ncbi:sugar phosphate isomerase/epimerase family protein [Roseimaritima sediminicola]|uniref:sugar phosphate isomerase/epimerase family protein n=1 Tax=Roseimaritima sediminicola TaxID=2662066 RepID=UPI0012982FD3|nr:sugar phosphate isomerase/epimerase family protein [Roseimaritima sediminicola]
MTSRRSFLKAATAASVAAGLAPRWSFAEDKQPSLTARSVQAASDKWLLKTLKIGMVGVPGSLTDKFKAAKQAGFDGIELSAPGIDLDAARRAIDEAQLPVDGTVNGTHWQIHHTDPDPKVRQRALESLKNGIRETAALGGDTILLVPGVGGDGPADEIFDRAVKNIREALEDADKYNVKIAIENVWNQMLYDHDGDATQTADQYVRFVDAFDSPLVGMQFDIGNHWKYGDMAAWIRQLDHRIIKLDAKGFSREQNKFTKIGEGDLDWVSVRQALKDIQFTGWVAAEVGGGNMQRLKEISQNLDDHLVNEPA